MADYPISKEAVIRELINLRDRLGGPFAKEVLNMALASLEGFPSAYAAEVVRCRECKYYVKKTEPQWWSDNTMRCNHPDLEFEVECYDHWLDAPPDGFCYKGEKRDGGTDT